MQCGVNATSDVNKREQQTEQREMEVCFSFNEELDIHVVVRTLHSVLMGAWVIWMTCTLREWSFVPGEPCFFLCCGHMAKFFLSIVWACAMLLKMLFFRMHDRVECDGGKSMRFRINPSSVFSSSGEVCAP